MEHHAINWLAFLDLIGLLLTTAGAILLALPALADILQRKERAGLTVWTSNAPKEVPGAGELKTAEQAIVERGTIRLQSDLRRVRWGVWLILVGLVMAIPIKIDAL